MNLRMNLLMKQHQKSPAPGGGSDMGALCFFTGHDSFANLSSHKTRLG